MRHPAGETIAVARKGAVIPGEYDEQGNPKVSPDTTFNVSHVAIAPAVTEEDPQSLGLVVSAGFTLFLPYGTVLHATDRMTIRGVGGWQVVGDTEASGWRNPFNGLTPGSVVSVRRAV